MSNTGKRPGSLGKHGVKIGMPVVKAKNFKGSLKRLLGYLKPYRWRLLAVFGLAILSTAFSIVSPKILGKATTKLFEGIMLKYQQVPGARVDFEYILQILLFLVGLYIFSACFSYLQQYLMAGIAQKTVYDLRQAVQDKLNRLPLKYFDARPHGEILSRVTNDVDNIGSTLQQSLTQSITSLVTLVGILLMMLSISPLMTLIAVVIVPLSLVVTVLIAKRSQKYFATQQKELGILNGHVEEMYTGHPIVKAFGREGESVEKFQEINQRLYEVGWKAQFISGIISPLISFIGNIGYVLVCVVGSSLVLKNKIEIGDIQAFIQYTRQFTHPIMQTANIANIIQSTVASAERVFELLDEAEQVPEPDKAKVLAFPRGEVELRNVTFGYGETNLIENMNLHVKPGQTVAIVGPTGAGKTTLVNLLMRFYEIKSGQILVDGVDIREMKRGDLRTLFGMVLQDTWLFNGTIRDNIAYGRVGASEQEIVQAARMAHADHFIRTLPEGYDTVLDEEASNISQGQKQLLTIARAILADPSILILDEATSNVDTRTEVLIQKAMLTLMKGRTSFVIAHRLSTIREADLILVMNQGSIIEMGNHQELLAKGGFYADLYQSQFASTSREAG
ncbi:ABC transporter ATP-binding protein [Desulforamulus ferrireducens]|uniref:ABC transporter n=1 Tax=Desulforamulus ferrireducens TaxID=1833852 RepID=A0A1S6ITJ3_9FIRM|nr:ABC transporter ATP-binding protein [Desulforamulus ferrireducens]AQS58091.1 ABC transporter [Desulforamulus ferrireducens]